MYDFLYEEEMRDTRYENPTYNTHTHKIERERERERKKRSEEEEKQPEEKKMCTLR